MRKVPDNWWVRFLLNQFVTAAMRQNLFFLPRKGERRLKERFGNGGLELKRFREESKERGYMWLCGYQNLGER